MFENVKVGDKLYLHDTYARRNEKPFKVITVNKIGKKYIFCSDPYSDRIDYKIDINTGKDVKDDCRCERAYNSVEEIKNDVILTKMTIFADEWMRKIDNEDKYKLYLQFKDIIDEYINIDEINEKYSL